MATIIPVTFNSGSSIPDTTQVGNLAVGTSAQDYGLQPGGKIWWSTPDLESAYVVAHENLNSNQPNPLNISGVSVGFWKSVFKNEESFLELANYIANQDNDPQNFTGGTDAKTWLNNNGYWTSFVARTPFSDLQTISVYLRNYMSEFRNPNFYNYRLDGEGYYISDGGDDMYDNGNISTPWLIAGTQYTSSTTYSPGDYPFAVDYTQSATTQMIDTSFGYISLGYEQYNGIQSSTYLPLTVIGSRDNTTYGDNLPVGFQTGGDSGSDGGGTLGSGYIYNGSTVSGFTVYAFYRETFNASDPSHCDLYILLGHPNWDSNFGTVNSFAAGTNTNSCGGYLYSEASGTKNVLAIKTLLSKQFGVEVTSGECQTVVNNFINRVKLAVGF